MDFYYSSAVKGEFYRFIERYKFNIRTNELFWSNLNECSFCIKKNDSYFWPSRAKIKKMYE